MPTPGESFYDHSRAHAVRHDAKGAQLYSASSTASKPPYAASRRPNGGEYGRRKAAANASNL